jgi:hypothetical protein
MVITLVVMMVLMMVDMVIDNVIVFGDDGDCSDDDGGDARW